MAVDYSQPVTLDTSHDPRQCPVCHKAQNSNFVPLCDCRAFSLEEPIEDDAEEETGV